MKTSNLNSVKSFQKITAGLLLLAASAALTPIVAGAAAFTPGNLVIYRAGDGVGNEINTGNPVFLDEYTTAGTLIQSIALPTTPSGAQLPLVASGTATSEGLLTLSMDGQYLILTGYGSTIPAASSLPGSASTSVSRVIGRVDSAGNIDTSTGLTNFATAGNPRSAVSEDGTTFWITGSVGGVGYATLGSAIATNIASTPANLRQINIFSNQLYISTSSGSAVRVGAVGTGKPIAPGQAIVNLPGFSTAGSPYAFFLATLNGGAVPDTLYVADDAIGNGLQKWSLVSGSWVSNGVVTAEAAVRGLVGVVDGTTVTLYSTTGGSATAGGGTLWSLTDTAGYNADFSSTTPVPIAVADSKKAFRGVAFAPVAAGNPITKPIIQKIQVTGGNAVVDFTGGANDDPAVFIVLVCTNLAEAFTTASALVVSNAPGQFSATIAAPNPAAFYRIQR